MAVPQDIILGDGVFSINDVDIALTRGGGKFAVEREYRMIDADGDYGPVKGRIRKIRSVAKLTLNALELLPANLGRMYPSTNVTGTGTEVFTGKSDVGTDDYQDKIVWSGRTKTGLGVVIILENAVNLENIDWSVIDKEETVPEITYTCTALEASRDTERWSVLYARDPVYTVTFTVENDLTNPVEGAVVRFNYRTVITDDEGKAVYTFIPVGASQPYTVKAEGYNDYSGTVSVVNDHVNVTATLVDEE